MTLNVKRWTKLIKETIAHTSVNGANVLWVKHKNNTNRDMGNRMRH